MLTPISPDTGAPEVLLGEHQEEYITLPAAIYELENEWILRLTRWKLSTEQLEAMARGEHIFVGVLTPSGQPFPPIIVQVGPGEYQLTPR